MRSRRSRVGGAGGLVLACGLLVGGCDASSVLSSALTGDPIVLLVLNPLSVPSELVTPVNDLMQNGFSAQVLLDLFTAIGALSQALEPDLDVGQPFLVAGFRFGSSPQVAVNGFPAPVLAQFAAQVPGGTFTAAFAMVPSALLESFGGNKVKITGSDGSTSVDVGVIHRLAAVVTTDAAACTPSPAPAGSPHRVEFVSALDGSLRTGVGAPLGPARNLPCAGGNEDYASVAFSPDGLFDLVADRQNGILVLDTPFVGGLSKEIVDALGLPASLDPVAVDLQALAQSAITTLGLGGLGVNPQIHIQDIAVQPQASQAADFLVAFAASLTDPNVPLVELGILGAMRLPNLPGLIRAAVDGTLQGGTVDFQTLLTGGTGALGVGFAATVQKGTILPAIPRRLALGPDGLLVAISGAPGAKNTQVHVLDLTSLPSAVAPNPPPLCDLGSCLATLDVEAQVGAKDLVDLEILETATDAAAFLLDATGGGTLFGLELANYSCTPVPGGNPPCPGAGSVLSAPSPPVALGFPGLVGPFRDLSAGTMLDGTPYLVVGQAANDVTKNLLSIEVLALQPVTLANLSCPTEFKPCGGGPQDPLDGVLSIGTSPLGDRFVAAVIDDAATQHWVQLELRDLGPPAPCSPAAFVPFGCAPLAPSSAPSGVQTPGRVGVQGN